MLWVDFSAGSGEMTSCALDNSLTNIQWLGRMSSDGLSPSTVKQEMEKENQTPVQVEGIKVRSTLGMKGVEHKIEETSGEGKEMGYIGEKPWRRQT